MQTAGLDGVEIVGGHGYLPSQFLNPRVNLRDDAYGGDFDGRLRFLREVIADIRGEGERASSSWACGSPARKWTSRGLTQEETPGGDRPARPKAWITSTSRWAPPRAWAAPFTSRRPMSSKIAYVAPYAARIRQRVRIPVFVAGRINQPQDAEAILAAGQADVCAHDPRADLRSRDAEQDPARRHPGHPRLHRLQSGLHRAFSQGLSDFLHPESRQRAGTASSARCRRARLPRTVLVVGGGPAGMKAAVIAAQRGHRVTLVEAQRRLGGQALLAQLLPGRAEFGGLVTNLQRELSAAGVEVRTSVRATGR